MLRRRRDDEVSFLRGGGAYQVAEFHASSQSRDLLGEKWKRDEVTWGDRDDKRGKGTQGAFPAGKRGKFSWPRIEDKKHQESITFSISDLATSSRGSDTCSSTLGKKGKHTKGRMC